MPSPTEPSSLPRGRAPVLVVGAGYAGVMVANRLASHAVPVRLVSARPQFVERIRLHQHIAGTGHALRPLRDLLHPGVEVVVGGAERIDAAVRAVAMTGGEQLSYERLVLATGSISTAPAGSWDVGLPGPAEQARRHLASLAPGSTVAVVGGGLTGVETATEVAGARPDLTVELVTGSLLADLSAATVARAERTLRRLGIQIVRARLVRLEGPDAEAARTHLVLDDGSRRAASSVLWCGPFRGAPLARVSGLPVDGLDRLLVDDLQRSSADSRVWGAGDAAAHPANRRMSCQSALPSGAAVADAVLADLQGGAARPFTLRYSLRCISLGRHGGLVQPSRGDDRAFGPALGGAALGGAALGGAALGGAALGGAALGGAVAAVVKERVCLATVGWLSGQARGKDYRWRR